MFTEVGNQEPGLQTFVYALPDNIEIEGDQKQMFTDVGNQEPGCVRTSDCFHSCEREKQRRRDGMERNRVETSGQ